MAAFTGHFGLERLLPLPLVTASEDVGIFGEAAGIPTVFWFWGGPDTPTVLSAMAEGRLDSLTVAARTLLQASPEVQE